MKWMNTEQAYIACSVFIHFIHLVVCLTTGPKSLPKRALYIVRSRASCFRCEYPLLSLRSSSSSLRLLPRLPVTSIPPFIFYSITCRRTQNVTNPVHRLHHSDSLVSFRVSNFVSRGTYLISIQL
jgi:hypothetical protein